MYEDKNSIYWSHIWTQNDMELEFFFLKTYYLCTQQCTVLSSEFARYIIMAPGAQSSEDQETVK